MTDLSPAQHELLWEISRHTFGWTFCRGPQLRTARALERNGLLTIDMRRPNLPTCAPTDTGRELLAGMYPVSPFTLDTNFAPAGGWTPREGVAA